MFENFTFVDGPVPATPPTPLTWTMTHSDRAKLDAPLTPPLSPTHDDCYRAFTSTHPSLSDPLTNTLSALGISPSLPPSAVQSKSAFGSLWSSKSAFSPESSDSESELTMPVQREDVRRKRQTMARLQTDDDLLRQLGELVRTVGSKGAELAACSSSASASCGVSKRRSYKKPSRSTTTTTTTPRPRPALSLKSLSSSSSLSSMTSAAAAAPNKYKQTKGSGRRPALASVA